MNRETSRSGLAALTLGAIGVVYGDIGTSPLYTLKEVFLPATGVALNTHNLIGATSVIVWALMFVVTLKYVVLILRADNRGEGGALALTALAAHAVQQRPRLRNALLLLGLFGATLFYGDSVITPAISVMGAIEGLEVATPTLKPYVLPISTAILLGLFLVQRFGTAAVGKVFGPVIVLWFAVLAASGAAHIAQQPGILAALNPLEAWAFLSQRGWHLFAAVGAIVLALTGAEALYADMGHFGARPIRLAWTGLVFPALALNYLGQGALLMGDASAIENPFFRLFPGALVLPMVGLAALAAVIASQAVISGAYSMTRQAVLLGFLPRMGMRHTSASESGQIYVPAVNWALLAGVVGAVLVFGSSSALAGAYGIAVTLTMLITTVLTFFVIRDGWGLPAPLAVAATTFFLAVDALLVAGCAIKFFDGGWLPLALGLALFVLMSTWARGRKLLMASLRSDGLELLPFIESLAPDEAHRARRTAVYAVADPTLVPQALLHNLKHNQVLHETNVILNVAFHDHPVVDEAERVEVTALSPGFWRVLVHYGFMEEPDVPAALALCGPKGLAVQPFETSYFLSRETVVPTPGGGMANWRERLFSALSRNSSGVAGFFKLPDNAVVELGTRVQI
ncbi:MULTISPECIES: potassium transporter Kup [Roseateles]|uniref:Probable potassium transport system protein Kup n=1 Tax=Pelomonas caseinilytica TaxID=2906763 RepID=A0ABS8XBG6_9BURK|nr:MULTISPECIES: potassium transporter Kup [unclassified Roseateles]MCE4535746.1 potassium transporter Kup [Pelomonas sp. P7]HEV6968682.1 potassium transporter Kup [Roseateles sp.]